MRLLPHVVWVVGLVVLVGGLGRYSGAAMPYQDPTPELLAVQRGRMESSRTAMAVGGLVFVGGAGWAVARRRSRSGDSNIS